MDILHLSQEVERNISEGRSDSESAANISVNGVLFVDNLSNLVDVASVTNELRVLVNFFGDFIFYVSQFIKTTFF